MSPGGTTGFIDETSSMYRTTTTRTTRRAFLKASTGAATASLLAAGPVDIAQAQSSSPAVTQSRGPHNILFVFTDQERFQSRWPQGLSLPGHERLERTGVTFTNHQCPATMCTSSRSVIVTGLQTATNGMYENLDVPWMRDLPTSNPTIGHMLRKAGYYTAYKGKWHLSREFDTTSIDLGGYSFDHITAGSAINWLRTKGRPLSDDGKPWCMYVSFVNPHDVMYFNTDAPGEQIQDTGKLRLQAARAPEHALYKSTWDVPLPDSLRQSFDAPGRPAAHGEFDRIWDYILGHIPPDEARWRRFNDYYINCIRNVDRSVEALLAELQALQLDQNTIVIYTSDHGEMAGAHGLRGKGPFAYQQTNHLPLYVVHPDVAGGQQCKSLSSHIDFVPTMLSMAGVAPDRAADSAGRPLPGKDLSGLLAGPGNQAIDAARPATLFTYSGLASNDSAVFDFAAKAVMAGKDPKLEARQQGFKPDLRKRGHVRSAFDGRYRFTRYFAPVDHNSPATIDELFKWNDVELYDLANDPGETDNLALARAANAEVITTMNAKLEAVIKSEIGKDDGHELPDIAGVTWGLDKVDL